MSYKIEVKGGPQYILEKSETVHIDKGIDGDSTLFLDDSAEYTLSTGDIVLVDGEIVWEEGKNDDLPS